MSSTRMVSMILSPLSPLESKESLLVNQEQLKHRTKKFAHDCVDFALSLPNSALCNHVRGQLMRAGTSVASNYRAANLAHSKASFAAKISIVLEEADESGFWIEFLKERSIVRDDEGRSLLREAQELVKIFYSTRRTARSN